MKMELKKDSLPPVLVESGAYEGVRRIGGKVAEDIRKVTGGLPKVVTEEGLSAAASSQVILCATLGKSRILDALAARGLVDTEELQKDGKGPKWEVYRIRLISVENEVRLPLPESIKKILLICGSDKRGTIYGMFSLSEYMGVSPLCYWGDAEPVRRESLMIGEDIETLSREPSVKYRGFFINDEWPCFGNWVMEHFGDFNAEAYDHVFELLLRLKGNYLWPAMWSASFPLDGPGSGNEELADLYGVVMGYSHHEPCLRASEEWDKVRGEKSRYGNEWNFRTNEAGLLRYWEDALKRSGKYENVITIGMRGERDTSMLGRDATLQENIALLKDIISKQRALIDLNVKRESGQVPLMLALYKEVEPYFYGDGQTPGLKDWEGLKGVTCMLCEDNYGYMRTLPSEDIRGREGGFGMYYHLDYHGGPVSYEWVDSTPFSRIWEQMSEAYEYGIRDIWIVNVGDLKFHEVPLSYFMALAYDYEKWGYGNQESSAEYTRDWVTRTFPGESEGIRERIGRVLTDYIRLNSLRRPESLHPGVYHPCHYEETDRMLEQAVNVEKLSCEVLGELWDRQAYYSMVHYPAMASMNLLKLHLYAGKNHHYAAQNRKAANRYADLVQECIRADRAFQEEWAAFREGKWNGMQLARHVGFTGWCETDYRYPVMMRVEPVHCPRLSVSRKDEERTVTAGTASYSVISVPDFQYAGCDRVTLEIANEGYGTLRYKITAEREMEAEEETETAEAAGEGTAAGQAETETGDTAEGGKAAEQAVMEAGKAADEGTAAKQTVTEAGKKTEEAETAVLPEWLTVSPLEGEAETLQEIELRCDRAKLPRQIQKVSLWIEGDDTKVKVNILARAAESIAAEEESFTGETEAFAEEMESIAGGAEAFGGGLESFTGETESCVRETGRFFGETESLAGGAESFTEVLDLRVREDDGDSKIAMKLPPMTFLGRDDMFAIKAEHFCNKKDTEKGEFRILKDYGKHGSGVKVFPSTAAFGENGEKPELTYRFLTEKAGEYQVELHTSPANSLVNRKGVHFLVSNGAGESVTAELIPADFAAGDCADARWSGPALAQERKTCIKLHFGRGLQEIRIGAMEAGTVLERILIYKVGTPVPESYLGQEESYII